jgi:predicted phage terminase large subunit-like protein
MANFRANKDLQLRWQQRIEWIQGQSFTISDTPKEKQERIERARKDYAFFVKTYFPLLAAKKCGKFQLDAANCLKSAKETRALFEWARGHAKSSHLSLMIPLWLKIQQPRQINVMILVSKSEEMAVRLLSDLQAELQYNQTFIHDFGDQMRSGSWADGEFHTTDGCLFVALGRGQSPRGLKDRGKRPDYIVVDDIDDDELIRNPRRVGEALDWVLTALAGTMEMGRGRFVMVGNRIGKDSILSRFATRPGVHHTIVNALDKHGLPSWPENYTPDEIRKMREFVGERRFQKEYMNNPVNEGSVFQKKHIQYGPILDLKFYKTLICYTDPSFKSSATADFKATMLIGKTPEGQFHVVKAFADQTSVMQMVSWHYTIMAYVDGKVPVLYYMESNFLQELLLDEFKKAGNLSGQQIPIRGDARKKPDKFARVEAMQPLFERGLIILNQKEKDSNGMTVLEEQLLMFEKGSKSHDDAPDALEGAIWLLSQRTRASNAQYMVGKRENRHY